MKITFSKLTFVAIFTLALAFIVSCDEKGNDSSNNNTVTVLQEESPLQAKQERWEYTFVKANSMESLIAKSNKLGAEGWEMVTITFEGSVFKRKLP